LGRFVFTNSGAVKLEKDVEFKVNDLDLTPYLSGPLQSDSRPVFNMYGCVCHFGSVYGGHYTAFARHMGNNSWNYFDDGYVNEQKVPGESPGDFSSGYILFYQRSGMKICRFCQNSRICFADFRYLI
jgi:ubiquitin C-terminal hydrolase